MYLTESCPPWTRCRQLRARYSNILTYCRTYWSRSSMLAACSTEGSNTPVCIGQGSGPDQAKCLHTVAVPVAMVRPLPWGGGVGCPESNPPLRIFINPLTRIHSTVGACCAHQLDASSLTCNCKCRALDRPACSTDHTATVGPWAMASTTSHLTSLH